MAAANSENSKHVLRLTPEGESDEEKLKFIEDMTMNCDEVQERVLAEILTQNGETEYLRRHGLAGATDRATFKAKIPIVTYEDLKPEIQRIANGDDSAILSGHPISEFLTSSGTSAGERKLMPTITQDLDRRHLLYSLLTPVINQYVPGLDQGKGLYFLFVKPESRTPGGLLARPVLTSYYKNRPSSSFHPYYTSPPSAILCPDPYQSMYVQLLCGLLLRPSVLRIGSVFASALLRALRFLRSHWPLLASDISSGILSPSISDPSLRSSVSTLLLRPDPDLSLLLSRACSSPNWSGIIPLLWPNAKFLDVIITGSMSQYLPTLHFFSNGLPIASTMYASSECYFGLNLSPLSPPHDISYTILPNMAFFEFLPLRDDDDDNSSPVVVDLAALQIGCEYELVVTTHAGLCRYRVGDVLRVTGFHNLAPKFCFVRRQNVVLSVEADKTDEEELQRAVERAAKVGGVTVAEYTCQASAETIPGHYVIYWELLCCGEEEEVRGEVMERCCLEMEEEMNSVYRQGRVADGSIGPLEIRVVRQGTFEEMMDYAISRGASINQYKVPRCVSVKPMLELLDARVVSRHFSQGMPKWSPDRFG